ncbi:MAG: flavodoxin-dependent (E)-4-hydroxy-3-methylbut-2-enyl-diphosphate synthase [Oscillospiraceae bacterium]|nr:flavodoxin-dependent (E)-4-hydroxy-3-methylbut-2-enyl-diphosphate synthase [Oscillospiraceae bacterium]
MTKQIYVGNVPVGGGAPVSIQSMCSTKTDDITATVAQILRLEQAGCEIVRVAVPDMAAAKAIGKIKSCIHIPLVADIHFDYKLALECATQGVDKIRINPGNIGGEVHVKMVADACRERKIPIRIGVNGGSLEKDLREKYGGATAEALVESALGHAALLEKFGFDDICISVKCSSVPVTIHAYRLLSEQCSYPLHLGVTEAGTLSMGMIKSAMGIGGLLCLGIGDTMRVTLTADPVEEIFAAKKILRASGLRQDVPNLISCPTCGRTNIDLIPIAEEVERRLSGCRLPVTVAVMGCAVNGPGEAASADVGIAGGKGEGLVFRKGKILRKVPQEQLVDALMEEIEKITLEDSLTERLTDVLEKMTPVQAL